MPDSRSRRFATWTFSFKPLGGNLRIAAATHISELRQKVGPVEPVGAEAALYTDEDKVFCVKRMWAEGLTPTAASRLWGAPSRRTLAAWEKEALGGGLAVEAPRVPGACRRAGARSSRGCCRGTWGGTSGGGPGGSARGAARATRPWPSTGGGSGTRSRRSPRSRRSRMGSDRYKIPAAVPNSLSWARTRGCAP